MAAKLNAKIISSLEKCFHDEALSDHPRLKKASMLRNERYSFQLAMQLQDRTCKDKKEVYLRVKSALAAYLEVKLVREVPSMFPCYGDARRREYLRRTPGLYPDLLEPLAEGREIPLVPGQLRSLWFTIEPHVGMPTGEQKIELELLDENSMLLARETLALTVIGMDLPAQGLTFTQWFHCDCLAVYYGAHVFSERHWEIIENFLRTARRYGMNMVLTPVFTPPLDTAVGAERPTVQLVDVTVEGGKYRFGFEKLDRWVHLCLRLGFEQFEISHFFTQWGAAHAPKIVARAEGRTKRIFGWETEAAGEAYASFLHAFLDALIPHLKELGIDSRCRFHISDEPSEDSLGNYQAAKRIVEERLKGYPIMDALSSYEFYRQGVSECPIPSNDHIEPFLEHSVPHLWTYYCCGQSNGVSNRFLSMPSVNNRIIGTQFYKYGIEGFLHWGYNFYFSQLSRHAVNPFLVTDGDYMVPSGDAFSVYPAPDGTAWESLRLVVFHEALQDQRALELCESLYGRAFVMRLLEGGLRGRITFSSYPRRAAFLLRLRERVNAAIAARQENAEV